MVSQGDNGFGSAYAGFQAAILGPEYRFDVGQTLRAQPQGISGSIVNFASNDAALCGTERSNLSSRISAVRAATLTNSGLAARWLVHCNR
jgi:hypothetical protein